MADLAAGGASTIESALLIMRQRPRLAAVLLAVHDLTANRRNCRLMVEVTDGVVRLYREVPTREIDLGQAGDESPAREKV